MNYTKLFLKLLKTYNINIYFSIREFICERIDASLMIDINSDPLLQLIESSHSADHYICNDRSKNYLSNSKWHPVLFYTCLYSTDTINLTTLLDLNRMLWHNENMYNLGLKYIKFSNALCEDDYSWDLILNN